MTSEDTNRRLMRLKKRQTLGVKTDEYLEMLLEDALRAFLEYTHRTVDPGEEVDSLLCAMATVWANQEGGEGSTHAKDGEVEREWLAFPADIEHRMKSYRILGGLSDPLGL